MLRGTIPEPRKESFGSCGHRYHPSAWPDPKLERNNQLNLGVEGSERTADGTGGVEPLHEREASEKSYAEAVVLDVCSQPLATRPAMSVRVLIIDDCELIRRGWTGLLAGSEFEVVGTLDHVAGIFRALGDAQAKLVLIDLRLLEAVNGKSLRKLAAIARIVVSSAGELPRVKMLLPKLGASGVLHLSASRRELLAVLRRALATSAGNRCATNSVQSSETIAEVRLTRREREILELLPLGLDNREIARRLRIAYDTVKEYVTNIFRKLNVTNRTQAAVWAVRNGLACTAVTRGELVADGRFADRDPTACGRDPDAPKKPPRRNTDLP